MASPSAAVALHAKPRLVIVQNRETQFDAPLYAQIEHDGAIDLTVLYSEPAPHGRTSEDPEIGRPPSWDHIPPGSYRAQWAPVGGLLAALWMARLIRAAHPNLVIVAGYFPRSHLILTLLLKLRGQRVGLRSDNTLQHTRFRGWRGRLRRLVIGWIQRLYDTWHPVGGEAEAYLRALSSTSRPTFAFPYAVDQLWFEQRAAEARQQRMAFLCDRGWPSDSFVVLGILKWSAREDPLTLIDGFRLLGCSCPRARMVLVGDGPLRAQVEQQLADLGDHVFCPGYAPYSALPFWYGVCDVFVHPAIDEPWGVSVNEALACGVPVVASDMVGAGLELVAPSGSGLIFPAGDAQALALCLENLAVDPGLLARCAHQARATGRLHASQATVDQLIGALEAVGSSPAAASTCSQA